MNNIIARIENYKMSAVGGVGKEQERDERYIEKYYQNPDHHPERMGDNVTLLHDSERNGKTWERYIKDYREEHNIQGRFTTKGAEKSQTNVATSFMITTSPEYMNSLTTSEQKMFFKDSLNFLQKEYPSYHFVEATVHLDEKTPHLHVLALPLYYDKDKDITIFSTTKTQVGKEHYREFQDHLYEHMSRIWNGLERGERGSKREHLSVKEYKELQKEREHLEQSKRDFEEEKKKYDKPVPQKTILSTKYSREDVEKVVDERNTAYAEIERLQSKNRSLERDIESWASYSSKLKESAELEHEKRIELQEKLNDKDYLKEHIRELDRTELVHERAEPER